MVYTDADEEVYMYVLYGGTKLASSYNKAFARNGKVNLPAIHRQPHPHVWFQKIVM